MQPNIIEPAGRFSYDLSEGRKFARREYDGVKFDISRAGTYTHTIMFGRPLIGREVLKRAEDYLSVPVTRAYLESINNETGNYDLGTRGDCIRGAVILESVDLVMINGKRIAKFFCGS